MQQVGRDFHAPCGFVYRDGDFRVDIDFSRHWAHEQEAYEEWLRGWRADNDQTEGRIESVDASFQDVYEQIRLEGSVLDVGGDIGTVVTQAGLDPDQYVSLDPMRVDFDEIERDYPRYFQHYKKSSTACFIQGSAEFLPVTDLYFDCVQMRTCIDHFAAPHLALREAYRVLRRDGSLVVGVSLEGAYQKEVGEWSPLRNHPKALTLYQSGIARLKEYPRIFSALSGVRDRMRGVHDVHLFHPTYDSLISLLRDEGFRVEKEVWQAAHHNVLYVQACKTDRV
jgi:SAM-dependent methyltransferase